MPLFSSLLWTAPQRKTGYSLKNGRFYKLPWIGKPSSEVLCDRKIPSHHQFHSPLSFSLSLCFMLNLPEASEGDAALCSLTLWKSIQIRIGTFLQRRLWRIAVHLERRSRLQVQEDAGVRLPSRFWIPSSTSGGKEYSAALNHGCNEPFKIQTNLH